MLETVKLDDLKWGEMVVAIRRRIAAASAGNWTLHAPVDPGITLLELFAFLLEQRVYWMDQVPDSLVGGALSLLGEHPLPTQVAATVMHFSDIEAATILDAHTQLTLLRSAPPLVFSTESEIILLPFAKTGKRLGLFIDGKDRTADLEHGKVVRLFPADGAAAEIKIELWLTEPLPDEAANKCLSLLFELRDPRGVAPQWSPDAPAPAAAPPPAQINWFYSGANGRRLQFADEEVADGTGGLRRSGLVLLPIKTATGEETDWQQEASDAEGRALCYSLWMRVEETTFSSPPRLERLLPNVVIASHRRMTREHMLHRELLPLPGNVITLADLPEQEPVKDHPPIENTIKLSIREADGNWHEWEPTADLGFHGPADRVFVTDRSLGRIRFGDGLTGRLPMLAKDIDPLAKSAQLKVQYSVGGGAAGRLGSNLEWEAGAKLAATGKPSRVRGVNVAQTEGGKEPETMAAARERAATALRKQTRAVIREDYEEIARTVPGIAIKRAHAAIGLHPGHPCVPIPGAVTVFIVPDVSRPDQLSEDAEEFDETMVESAFVAAPVPDPGALAVVRAKLEAARLAGSEVFVSAPQYRPVALTLDVESNSADSAELNVKIKRRLRTFFDPLVGGDQGDGWPFGEPVRPSAILREAQGALGDLGTVVRFFIELLGSSKPGLRIDAVTDTLNRDCSLFQYAGPGELEKCGVTTLGGLEAAELRRLCRDRLITGGSQEEAQTCGDVLIGAHELVELRHVTVNFQRGAKSEGGLR
ncbi:MAG TPA: putative baseplate assembly protein [Blastocatellia bacterium]|nr:putative baseplate assembly protein [Blastocatellia bacterium]